MTDAAPFISVLLPTRGRSQLCLDSVTSLLAHAERPEDVEIVLRRDVDDATPYQTIPQSACVVGPPLSYTGLHVYYNECAVASRGTWLVFWNDDCEMRSRGWDTMLRAFDPAVDLLVPLHGYFPTVSRGWHEALGRVTGSPHADSYVAHVGDVLSKTGAWAFPQPVALWDVFDRRVTDEGSRRRDRDVGGPRGTSAMFFSLQMRAEIVGDAEKLRQMIERKRT